MREHNSQAYRLASEASSLLKMVLSFMSKVDCDDRLKDRTRQIEEEKNAPMH
jgi:hypothetical protein